MVKRISKYLSFQVLVNGDKTVEFAEASDKIEILREVHDFTLRESRPKFDLTLTT